MRNSLLRFEPALFDAYFDRKPFYVQAPQVAGHPLFAMEELLALARRLPEACVEYNAGALPVDASAGPSPRNGLSAEETLRRIEQCGSWMVLKRVEQDPAYRAVMDALLDELEPHARRQGLECFDRQAFVFVSSPGSVTPFHMDPEHNFLLQVRGTKTVHLWDPDDRFVVSEQDLETFHSAFVHRNLPYRAEFEHTAHTLHLAPGQGLHFPVTAPHWVKNGDAVSVSLSITFRSNASQRRALAHRANARLRRLGLTPRPVGSQPLLDGAKALATGAFVGARDAVLRRTRS